MLVVVTFVSALVHIYSIGYMSHDPYKPRFMSYLSLFTFSMLALVVSDNFLQLFFGWEGVGLCSYLLIGFWYKRETANNAAIKAFIVNRIGDFGLAIAIFLIFFFFGTINFEDTFQSTSQYAEKKIVFFGFEIKFNNINLYISIYWRDGKICSIFTSYLATRCNGGPNTSISINSRCNNGYCRCFLVVRCSPIFEYSQIAFNLVTVVGMITAIFAASVALVQNDIKKIVAYSTCSQLAICFLLQALALIM